MQEDTLEVHAKRDGMSARHGVLRAAQMGAGACSLMQEDVLEVHAKRDGMSARHGVLRAAQSTRAVSA